MKAVILAGGRGTRLAPYTKILPKPLMPIGDMPILEVLLRQMRRSGVDEVILTVGHLAELLKSFFKGGEKLGLKISYSLEDRPLGTAGPLSLVGGLDQTFVVANGDVLTTLDIRTLVDFHKQHKAIATIASHVRNVRINYGVILPNESNEIVGYIEKPNYEYIVSMGIYIFEPSILDYIPHNEYLDLPDLVLNLLDAGEHVMTYPYDGYWMDLGRVSDYEKAIEEFDEIGPQILGDEFLPTGQIDKTHPNINNHL
jgi:NDP-sugar pyrophosphorylase family protein